jgi:hypothetical protein
VAATSPIPPSSTRRTGGHRLREKRAYRRASSRPRVAQERGHTGPCASGHRPSPRRVGVRGRVLDDVIWWWRWCCQQPRTQVLLSYYTTLSANQLRDSHIQPYHVPRPLS